MTSQLNLQYALMCLEALESDSSEGLQALDISRRQGIPFDICRRILDRFSAARIVEADSQAYRLLKPAAELTALEILEALSAPVDERPAFRLFVGSDTGSEFQRTLQAAGRWASPLQVAEG